MGEKIIKEQKYNEYNFFYIKLIVQDVITAMSEKKSTGKVRGWMDAPQQGVTGVTINNLVGKNVYVYDEVICFLGQFQILNSCLCFCIRMPKLFNTGIFQTISHIFFS